jgi:CDP-4-dehydro-6-deoxyglucose reductase, E1
MSYVIDVGDTIIEKRPMATDTWSAEERDAAIRVIQSGRYTMGMKTAEFERLYAKYVGVKYCVAVNSGSSANLIMVAAWTLRYGAGTVVVPAVGWSTSYSPFQQYGWKLRFVDIDRNTLNYDTGQLNQAAEGADLVLAINLLGSCNDFDRFPDLPILEDNCESMGAAYHGRSAGSFGEMASHSTYFSHHLCTMEGGLITTNDKYFYHMLLSLRSHGWTRHLPRDNVFDVEPEKFSFILPGYNVRPTEIQCAVGIEQLKKLNGFVNQRRENADRFPWKKQREIGQSSWFGFVVYDDDVYPACERYESRPVVTGNFLRQKVIEHYNYEVHGKMTNADYIHDHCRMIGNSHERIDWE